VLTRPTDSPPPTRGKDRLPYWAACLMASGLVSLGRQHPSPPQIGYINPDRAISWFPLGLFVAISGEKSVAFVRTFAFAIDGASTRSFTPINMRQTVLRFDANPPSTFELGNCPPLPPQVHRGVLRRAALVGTYFPSSHWLARGRSC